MTRKTISQKPCQSKIQPAFPRASKRRETGSTSPKAKRQQPGESAKEPSKNGSKGGESRAASPSLPSKTSWRHPLPSGGLALGFDKQELRAIARCAQFDKKSPEAWAKAAILGWIPETLQAIQEPRRSAQEKAIHEARVKIVTDEFHKSILLNQLQLTPDLFEALKLVASWENWSFGEMCRLTLVSLLESEAGEMASMANDKSRSRRERKWAEDHQKPLAPILKNLGWNGTTFQQSRAVKSDGGRRA